MAEKEKKDLVVVCPACLTTLNKTNHYLARTPDSKEPSTLRSEGRDLQYWGSVKVRHLLEVIVTMLAKKKSRPEIKDNLSGLKVAPYYGCQFTRPFGEIDDKEFPTMLDTLTHMDRS